MARCRVTGCGSRQKWRMAGLPGNGKRRAGCETPGFGLAGSEPAGGQLEYCPPAGACRMGVTDRGPPKRLRPPIGRQLGGRPAGCAAAKRVICAWLARLTGARSS
jgi:hypothetical protein